MKNLKLKILAQEFMVHKFAPKDIIPTPILESDFYWIGKTDDELSIVCDSSLILKSSEQNIGWRCLKVLGPLDFSLTGILAGLSSVLAEAHISIFAISTFDTDYILVKNDKLAEACVVLAKAGHQIN